MSLSIPRALWAAAVLSLGLLLAACGGGGESSPPPAPALGSVSGSVVASTDSAPVAGAQVSVGALSTQTAADGSFTLNLVGAAARVVLKVEAAGFLDGIVAVAVTANQTARATARLTRAGNEVSIDAAAANVVGATGSTAQVSLAANSLVNAATGAAPTGAVTVRVTPIDPGTDPQSMPGDFTTSAGESIESFGAINVTLRDSTGARVDLSAGNSATIRIPLSSRSVNPPATIPLFYMDEATGRWVEQGSATLTSNGTDRWYEGSVTHFTTWNADQRTETIFVRGCVVDERNTRVTQALVHSVGSDYSGGAAVAVDAQGNFSVPMRRGGTASIYAEGANFSNTISAGPSQADITLMVCLVIGDTPLPPTIVEQPQSQSVAAGALAFFRVVATGTRPLLYQWRRNGVAIDKARGDVLIIQSAAVADDGAVFDVVVSNSAGSVTSAGATLSVAPPVAPTITAPPTSLSVAAGAAASFSVVAAGTAPLGYQWQRDGVDIAGATGPTYSIAATLIGDNGATFRVRVSNIAGSVTSADATLTVTGPALSPPTITQQPLNTTVAVGQSATFSVAVTGSPPPDFQWRRNGADIAGANASSYTAPPAADADNGAVFSVVVSNSQGSVTSNGATLTVSAATADDKVKLVRLLGVLFEFEGAAFLPFEATNDDGTAFVDPQNLCQSGTLAVSLNGAAVTPGQAVPDSGTFAAVANACSIDGTTTYTGSSSVTATLTSRDPDNGSATTNVSNMRVTDTDGQNVVLSDVTANGSSSMTVASSISGANTTSISTITPSAGATLRNELSGLTATFASGSVAATFTEVTATGETVSLRITYNNLTFSVGGVNYVGNGFYEIMLGNPPVVSGEVVLTSGGVRVGRIFADTDGLLKIEVDGAVQPFKAPRAHAR